MRVSLDVSIKIFVVIFLYFLTIGLSHEWSHLLWDLLFVVNVESDFWFCQELFFKHSSVVYSLIWKTSFLSLYLNILNYHIIYISYFNWEFWHIFIYWDYNKYSMISYLNKKWNSNFWCVNLCHIILLGLNFELLRESALMHGLIRTDGELCLDYLWAFTLS